MKTPFKSVWNTYRRDLITAMAGIVAFLIFIPLATYIYFAKDLKNRESLMERNDTGVVLLDRHGQIFFRFYDAKFETNISLSQIPLLTQDAILVSEDKDFYTHPGFSIKAITGAFIADFRKKDFSYGGSTITQQLVKNNLLSSQKNFLRKYQELILAYEVERRFKKKEILEMYLNSVYFGEGSFGIQEAAKTYFSIGANKLSLAQASLLAGLLTAPSELSPISGDYKKAKKRQLHILNKMAEEQYITYKDAKKASEEPLTFVKTAPYRYAAPHFALMVKDELMSKYGEEQVARSGFRVYTTVDLNLQAFAEHVVKNQVKKLESQNVSNGAAVVMDSKRGEILALVGSVDWNNPEFGKVNIALSKRQAGSSFKPIVYTKAFEEGIITPATILQDVPTTYKTVIGPYKPLDYDRKFRGPVTVRRALANSLNIPSVEVMNRLGVPQALEMAKRLGITTLSDNSEYGLSLVLGAGEVKLLELTNVYATLANNGKYNTPTTIAKIENKYNQTIYIHIPQDEQVVEPQYAFLTTSILSDAKARFEEFGNLLNISRQTAVKTGTTENYKDSLTLGYTPSVTVGVWVGNNDGRVMDNIAGSLGAAPIWKALMEKTLAGTPLERFDIPKDIVMSPVCFSIGTSEAKIRQEEYFASGTQPHGCIVAEIKPSILPPPISPPKIISPPNINELPPQSKSNGKRKKDI